MSEMDIVSTGYKELFGKQDIEIKALPQSGSDRKYFRIYHGEETVIGAYNNNIEENEAFLGFTDHFISKGLPVPSLIGSLPQKHLYFIKDLGDDSLYTCLQRKIPESGFDEEAEQVYRNVLDRLVRFQIEGIDGLDLNLCYPHKIFDRQSMMWDMNYFKYMFLKLVAVPFNESRLEHDFNALSDFLLQAGQKYFLYRDFQSANIMIVNGEPWFIDYQGGRQGAPQYDVASLLYDAKVKIPDDIRRSLLDYHIDNFCSQSGENATEFTAFFGGFSMIRLMQALGAFGFRGLYEKKPTFTGSIVPAVDLLVRLIDTVNLPIVLPELFHTIRLIPGFKAYTELSQDLQNQ